jgi:hypothetical protein
MEGYTHIASADELGSAKTADIFALQKAVGLDPNKDPVLQKFQRMRWFFEAKTPRLDRIHRLRLRYNLQATREPPMEGGSNIVIPIVRYICQSVVERLLLTHFSSEPYILVRPIRTTTATNDLELLLHHYQKKQPIKEWYKVITDAVLLGTGVGYKMMMKPANDVEVSTPYPYLRYVPLENFFVYPELPTLQGVIAVGHKETVSVKYLIDEYNLPDEVLERLWASPANIPDQHPLRVETPTTGWGIIELNRVIYYCEGKYYCIHYLPRFGLYLHKEVYPFPIFPYVIYNIMPSATIFGTGLGQMLEPFEEEITELHNLRLDNHLLTNLPIFKVRKGSTAQKIDSFSAGMKIPVETPQDIDVLLMPQQFGGILQEEQALMQLATQISGINEILMGQMPPASATAYAVETALLEGAVRFKAFYASAKEAFRTNAKLDLLFLKKWGDEVYISQVLNAPSPLIDFTIDDIVRETEFTIEPNTASVNRETDKQRWLIVRQLMYDQLPPEGRWEVDAQILRLMGINRPEAIIGEKPATPEAPAPAPETHPLVGLSVPDEMLLAGAGGMPMAGNPIGIPTDEVMV